jgi:hypothetical protein
MQGTHCYRFDDICIRLESTPAGLIDLIEKYTWLEPVVDAGVRPYISLMFAENFSASGLKGIVPTGCIASSETKMQLDGERMYKRYSAGEYDSWHVFEGYGAVLIDQQYSRIESYYCGMLGSAEMLPFLVLFISPLVSALQKFGYQYLHAAAVRIFGSNILLAGLSGRGKSTAALALGIKGYQVMTDESVLLRKKDGQFCAAALMNWIKVSRTAIRQFWPSFDKGSPIYDSEVAVKACELYMKPLKNFNQVNYVCILRQTGREETTIGIADALDVVPEILPVSMNTADKESMEHSFIFLTDLLKEVECRKISFGTDMDCFVHEMEHLAGR